MVLGGAGTLSIINAILLYLIMVTLNYFLVVLLFNYCGLLGTFVLVTLFNRLMIFAIIGDQISDQQ